MHKIYLYDLEIMSIDIFVQIYYTVIKIKEMEQEEDIEMKKRITKAEKIFKDTKSEYRKQIEEWGIEEGNVGYNRLETELCLCTRTLNAVQRELDKWESDLVKWEKLGLRNSEETTRDKAVADRIQKTINNHRKHNVEMEEELKD